MDLSVPGDLTAPLLLVPPADGRDGQLLKTSSNNGRDYYTLVITSSITPYPISTVYETLADIVLTLPSEAFGLRQISINGLALTDGVGVALKSEQNFSLTVDLGDSLPPLPDKDSLFLRADYLAGENEARINLTYAGKGWDELNFNLSLPAGTYLKRIEPGLLSMEAAVNGNQVKISSRYLLPDARPGEWHHLAAIIIGYDQNISGQKQLILSDISASRNDTVLVVDSRLVITLDFGGGGDGATVKYFLSPSHYYISLSRPGTRGTLELFWGMDNLIETTAGINCLIYLPTFMDVAEVVALDDNGQIDQTKKINFNLLSQGEMKQYALVYSTTGNNVLLPNARSNNPRQIMRLRFYFSDLCPNGTFVLIDDIVASGLDGRRLDETRSMNWRVDVLKFFNGGSFQAGDLDLNFGNEHLDARDLQTLIDIIDGKIKPTCYQLWAADMNGDGVIDSHDVTILSYKITTAVEDRPPDSTEPADSVYVCGYYLYYRIASANWALSIYDYMGRPVMEEIGRTGQGSVNLEDLKNGLYFYSLKIGGKSITKKFFIY
jgi:hypothetical protein